MLGFFFTILSAVLFGLSPLFTYAIEGCGLSVFSANVIRFGGAGVFILIMILIKGEKKEVFELVKDIKTSLNVFLVGITSAVTALLLSSSYSYLSSGLATVIHFTYPILVTIIYVLTGRVKLSFMLVFCVILSFLGIVLVTSDISGAVSIKGILLAFMSAVMFALHIFLLNSKSISNYPVDALMFWKCVVSTVFALVLGSLFGFGTLAGHFPVGAVILYPLLSCIAFPAFTYGTEKIGGPAASVLSAFEPITAVVVGILFLSEKTQKFTILGIIFVIISAVVMALQTERRKEV